jgi:hypothetical protein
MRTTFIAGDNAPKIVLRQAVAMESDHVLLVAPIQAEEGKTGHTAEAENLIGSRMPFCFVALFKHLFVR